MIWSSNWTVSGTDMRNIYCSCGYTATSRDDHDDHVVSVSRYDNTDHYETTNRTG